jgi:malate dehydrogenase (oxaloacetate-decarboxylating)(NADP+)
MTVRRQEALDYHAQGRPGKIQVSPTKPFKNQRDLSLAYTPGVAEPCREIAARPEDAYTYTAKGNLVAVVTNGTAVLGLGNIGALAAKPVMEGKGILFKAFADIDVFDLEVGSEDPDDVIRFCRLLEPTVGGINLEDIRSPDCFYIERELRRTLAIPVFHDDQHGTAIITGAALVNALEVAGKDLAEVRVVFAGAGAAAIATAEHYVRLGVPREHIVLCDGQGVLHADRDDLDEYRRPFAARTSPARSPTRCETRTCSWVCRWAGSSPGTCFGGWRRGRSSSPWRTRRPRSAPRRRGPRGPTRSSPRAGPITRTK